MSKLTISQKFQIALCILGVMIASTGQLTDLFGPTVTKYIVSCAGLLLSLISGVGAIVTGQLTQIQAVVNMAKDPNSPIQGIVTTATTEGKSLAASIPGPIVAAGSQAATDIAKP